MRRDVQPSTSGESKHKLLADAAAEPPPLTRRTREQLHILAVLVRIRTLCRPASSHSSAVHQRRGLWICGVGEVQSRSLSHRTRKSSHGPAPAATCKNSKNDKMTRKQARPPFSGDHAIVCLFVCFIASQHTLNQLRLQQYTVLSLLKDVRQIRYKKVTRNFHDPR